MQIEYVSEYERFGKKLVTEFSRDISSCPLFFFFCFLNFTTSLCALRNRVFVQCLILSRRCSRKFVAKQYHKESVQLLERY